MALPNLCAQQSHALESLTTCSYVSKCCMYYGFDGFRYSVSFLLLDVDMKAIVDLHTSPTFSIFMALPNSLTAMVAPTYSIVFLFYAW